MTEVEGPLFVDDCKHGKDCYVGTVEVVHRRGAELARYDVYVFDDRILGPEVCLRFGDEGGEYVSPGRVADFVKTAGCHWAEGYQTEYTAALELLMARGQIGWQRLPAKEGD
ncbi:hypothetical protein LCGC14_1043000 [marine sediment metagenome]|uniref:Uncharacterized protein n=1 Tax=marine sediment metagenome TaxID=412755 RepID=A0A0F9NCW7_9ZZZZ